MGRSEQIWKDYSFRNCGEVSLVLVTVHPYGAEHEPTRTECAPKETVIVDVHPWTMVHIEANTKLTECPVSLLGYEHEALEWVPTSSGGKLLLPEDGVEAYGQPAKMRFANVSKVPVELIEDQDDSGPHVHPLAPGQSIELDLEPDMPVAITADTKLKNCPLRVEGSVGGLRWKPDEFGGTLVPEYPELD